MAFNLAISWQGYLDQVLSGVGTGLVLALLGLCWAAISRTVKSQKYVVELPKVPSKLEERALRFGVLHVANDDGTLVNRAYWFKKVGKGKRRVAIRHPRRVGFQYKCFLDHSSQADKKQLMAELLAAGLLSPLEGEGKPNRIWFLLPSVAQADDPQGNRNNLMYPE